jgi:DHA3 family macrolide efflux protein-like MFS transporter
MEATSNWKYAQHWKAPFFTIWTGQAFSLLGSMLVSFTLIWWLTKTTGSATVLATASLAALLPQVLLGPITGTLVDRWNRRLVMILADSAIALATLLLAFLFLTGRVQIWQVYVLMAIRSIGSGFHWPAMTASTSLMVPSQHLARIQGMNQMLQGAMNIVSAPLGALLLEWLPIQAILMIDVSTAIIAVAPLLFIPVPQPVRIAADGSSQAGSSFWKEFVEGFRYAFSWPGLVMIGIMAALINLLLSPGISLLPILVTQHFNGQAFQLAWVESAMGLGIVIGGLLLSIWGGFKRRILTTLVGLFGLGLGCLGLGMVPAGAFSLAVALLFWLGFVNPITNGPLMAAVQAVVAPDMQGRVFTLIGSVASAMTPLGLIIAGPVADRFGVQIWFVLGGIITLVMATASLFIPAVMNFEQGRKIATPATDTEAAPSPTPAD